MVSATLVAAVVLIIPTLLVSGTTANRLDMGIKFSVLFQILAGVGVGVLLIQFDASITEAAIPAVAALSANGLVYLNNIRNERKAVSKYGDAAYWAADLINDEDRLFIIAFSNLNNDDRIRVTEVAESKEELRELTVEAFEQDDTTPSIPEEFA